MLIVLAKLGVASVRILLIIVIKEKNLERTKWLGKSWTQQSISANKYEPYENDLVSKM